jgi:hypothetical protein
MKEIKILLSVFIFFLPFNQVFSQSDPTLIVIDYKFKAEAEELFEKNLRKAKNRKLLQLRIQKFFKGAEFDEQKAIQNAEEEYLNSIILEDFYNDLTDSSQIWLKEFFNNIKPKYINEFDIFYTQYKTKSILELKEMYDRLDSAVFESDSAASTNSSLSSSRSVKDNIDHAKGDSTVQESSKFVVKRTYALNDIRKTEAFPDQSIELSGNFNNGLSSWYPDYKNYNKNWSGPAAGQSVLTWYSVPVIRSGDTLKTTEAVQSELANLMNTTLNFGKNYTHPENLKETLLRDEFRGSKGFCYYSKNATFDHIHDFLAHGNPVIILLGWDKYLHYVTLYGIKNGTGKYIATNTDGEGLDYLTLFNRWNFSDVNPAVKIVLGLAAFNPNMLFAYNDTGCNYDWEYIIPHNYNDISTGNKNELYFADFNKKYVENLNESYMDLNFFGIYDFNLTNEPYGAVTKVSSAGKKVLLHNSHDHIINFSDPANLWLGNISIDRYFDIEIHVDKLFLNDNPELGCGFQIIDKDGNRLEKVYDNCIQMASESDDPTNYVFKYSRPFNPDYRKVEFLIHEGWRKKTILLKGCNLDIDNDFICDDYDDDDDNDGISDFEDNCPVNFNPRQTDLNGNGQGFVCDPYEQCENDCNTIYFEDDIDKNICAHMCAFHAGSEVAFTVNILKNIKAYQEAGIDVRHRDFRYSTDFEELVSGLQVIYEAQGIRVSRRKCKRQLLNFIKEIGYIPVRNNSSIQK